MSTYLSTSNETSGPIGLSSTLSPRDAIVRFTFVNRLICTSLGVVVRLRVAHHIPDEEAIPLQELAAQVGVHQDSLARLLRLLSGVGIFKESRPGAGLVSHTDISRSLKEETPELVMLVTSELNVLPDLKLAEALQHPSKPAAEIAFGQSLFAALDQHPEWIGPKPFYAALSILANPSPFIQCTQLWEQFSHDDITVVDIGAGLGDFGIGLAKQYPAFSVQLQDREINEPEASKGIPDELRSRVRFTSHDFLQPQPCPPTPIVVYVVMWTFHNLALAECKTVLGHVRSRLSHLGSRLLIGESLVPMDDGDLTGGDLETLSLDVEMMSLFNARVRTSQEWKSLLVETGLQLAQVWTMAGTQMRLMEVKAQ